MANKNGSATVPTSISERGASVSTGRKTFGQMGRELGGERKQSVTFFDGEGRSGKAQISGRPVDGEGNVDESPEALRKLVAAAPAVVVTYGGGGEFIDPTNGKPKRESQVKETVRGSDLAECRASAVYPVVV